MREENTLHILLKTQHMNVSAVIWEASLSSSTAGAPQPLPWLSVVDSPEPSTFCCFISTTELHLLIFRGPQVHANQEFHVLPTNNKVICSYKNVPLESLHQTAKENRLKASNNFWLLKFFAEELRKSINWLHKMFVEQLRNKYIISRNSTSLDVF